jgi:non-heme chloroperoxidase
MPFLKTSAAPETKIHYQDLGRGQPVVLIHGWPLSHRMWESQVSALNDAGFRTIAYDRRGFGDSGQPAGGYDYDTFASDLADLINHLDLRNVVLVGFSMGGGEVARYIRRHGTERVAKAALLGAVPPYLLKTEDNPDGVDKSVFDEMLAGVKQDRIAFLADFFPTFYNAGLWDKVAGSDLIAYSKWIAWAASPLATRDCIVAFGGTDFRPDLAAFDVPTLIVHGDADAIVPIDVSGRRSHAMIPGSRLEVIEGAPHGFAATHADELNRILLDFLRG